MSNDERTLTTTVICGLDAWAAASIVVIAVVTEADLARVLERIHEEAADGHVVLMLGPTLFPPRGRVREFALQGISFRRASENDVAGAAEAWARQFLEQRGQAAKDLDSFMEAASRLDRPTHNPR